MTLAHRPPSPMQPKRMSEGSLAEVVEMILDKGLVIDIYIRVRVVGIELLTVDARIVIASVDTYLRLAEAAARLSEDYGRDIIGPLAGAQKGQSLPDLVGAVTESGAKSKTKGAVEGVKEAVRRK
jgi:gas vesicle structural protein